MDFTTGKLLVGQSLTGPLVLTYLAAADPGVGAAVDHAAIPLPMTGQLYIGPDNKLRATATLHDSAGKLLYSGYKPE